MQTISFRNFIFLFLVHTQVVCGCQHWGAPSK